MADDLWLTLVVAVSGAVLAALVALAVVAAKRGSRHSVSSLLRSAPSSGPSHASLARGVRYMYGPLGSRRRSRSVSANFSRAAQRIDAVDPYAVPRRIGEAMSKVGLTPPPGPAAAPDGGGDAGPEVRGPATIHPSDPDTERTGNPR